MNLNFIGIPPIKEIKSYGILGRKIILRNCQQFSPGEWKMMVGLVSEIGNGKEEKEKKISRGDKGN